MKRVLIADRSEVFCKCVAEAISSQYEVRICESGNEVLELCHTWRPDYMLLDLELPQIDGLTIIRTLHTSGQMVQILAKTSCIYSQYVMQSLAQMGVNYILSNPCTITEAVAQLDDMIRFGTENPWSDDDRIVNQLLHLGFTYGRGGFDCLCEALRIALEEDNLPITKVIYPRVAHICGGNPERVERAIRNAIVRAWKNRDERIWRYYFAPGRDGQIASPTNGDFIARMAFSLKRRKIV